MVAGEGFKKESSYVRHSEDPLEKFGTECTEWRDGGTARKEKKI